MKTIISLFILMTSLCFGCAGDRNYASRPLISANTQTAISPPTAEPVPAPTVPRKSNTAIVISPHANMRQYDNGNASVLEVVPQDASVEVIKQQGVWFLVKTETNQGWLHGNTLKLQSYQTPPVKMSTGITTVQPKPTIETNDTGATAKCADGTLSYSAHRRGTCSHHGGVAVWY